LLVEIAVGLILYFGGLKTAWLSIPGMQSVSLGHFSVIITVLWVVGLTNAINIIDGLDGLASGVTVIAAFSMAVIGFLFGISSVVFISLALAGSVMALWIFNRHPARIFLGDGGSLLIGYIFAVTSLIVPIKSFTAAALFLPLMVLGVPLTEIISSFLRRFAAGKNVMKADRRHIFHYLAYLGLTHRQIVALFYSSGLLLGIISILMFFSERVIVLATMFLFMVVIFILFFIFMAKIRKEKKPDKGGE
jgi:UDP-GlcNAc:undecaprenyl-phosphate GlcNAc-1-phosphate transferase